MKIIQPHKKIATKVTCFKDIYLDAAEIKEMMKTKEFRGNWKAAFSLHHSQVSNNPFDFFVVDESLSLYFGGYQVICNPRILEADDMSSCKEGCMSFPFRPEKNTKRYQWVHAQFQVFSKVLKRMKTVTMDLTGLPAVILQHEMDHARGVNIYEQFGK